MSYRWAERPPRGDNRGCRPETNERALAGGVLLPALGGTQPPERGRTVIGRSYSTYVLLISTGRSPVAGSAPRAMGYASAAPAGRSRMP